jgi:hypothetical protein
VLLLGDLGKFQPIPFAEENTTLAGAIKQSPPLVICTLIAVPRGNDRGVST